MNKFDLVFIGILALSGIVGLIRGVTKEILSLISWSGAILMSYILFPVTQSISRSYITNPMLADGITVFGVFLIFLVILTLVGHILSSMVRQSALSGIDRSLGFGYGIIRACIILFVFELVINCLWLRPEHPELIKTSRFANFMYKGSDVLYTVLPENTQKWIQSLLEKKLNERQIPSIDDIKKAGVSATKIDSLVQIASEIKDRVPSAEELSNLKPKEQPATKSDKKANIAKQDIDMERLIDIANTEN